MSGVMEHYRQLYTSPGLAPRPLMYQGKLDQAQTWIEHANGVLRRSHGEAHYRVAHNYCLLGQVDARQNRREEAE